MYNYFICSWLYKIVNKIFVFNKHIIAKVNKLIIKIYICKRINAFKTQKYIALWNFIKIKFFYIPKMLVFIFLTK